MKDYLNDWLAQQQNIEKQIRDAMNSPYLQAMQEMQLSAKLALESFSGAAYLPHKLEQLHRQYRDIYEMSQVTSKLFPGNVDYFRDLAKTSLAYAYAPNTLEETFRLKTLTTPAYSDILRKTSNALSQIVHEDIRQSKSWLNEFLGSSERIHFYAALTNPATDLWNQLINAKGFTEDLLNSIDESLANLETENEDPFLPFEEIIQAKAESLHKGEISYTTFLNFINTFFTIVSIIVTLHSLNPSNKPNLIIDQHFQHIESTQTRLLNAVESIRPAIDSSRYYVTMRQVSLTPKPKSKSARVGTLYPNQRVQLLKEKGKWIYVEYFDYTEGIPRTGWTRKKYMRLIVLKKLSPLSQPTAHWSGKKIKPITPTAKLQGEKTMTELLLEDRE